MKTRSRTHKMIRNRIGSVGSGVVPVEDGTRRDMTTVVSKHKAW